MVGSSNTRDELRKLLGPCPCDTCRLRERCAAEQSACAAFSMFVHGLPECRWRLAPRAPSRPLYLALFESAKEQRAPSRAYWRDPQPSRAEVDAALRSARTGLCALGR